MSRTRASLVALVALAIVTTMLTGCGRRGLVRVNGDKISKDEFHARLERVQIPTRGGAVPAGQIVVRQMIEEKLIEQLAEKQGVAPKPEEVDKRVERLKKQSGGDLRNILAQQNMTMEDLKKQQAATQAMVNVVTKGISVPDSEVKQMYEKMLASPNGGLKRPEQVMVSVIITKDKNKIGKAAEQVKSGIAFGSVAGKMSDEEFGTKQQNGRIGWVSRDGLMAAFRGEASFGKQVAEKVFSLGVGKTTEIITVPTKPSQYMIVRADQKRKPKTTPYEDVKDAIREQLALQQGYSKGDAARAMQKFTKDADIVINTTAYKPIGDQIKKEAANALKNNAQQPTPATGAAATGGPQ